MAEDKNKKYAGDEHDKKEIRNHKKYKDNKNENNKNNNKKKNK